MIVFALLAGIAIGVVIGYLLMRGRVTTADERSRAAQDKYALLEKTMQSQTALVEGRLGERLDIGHLVGPIRDTLTRVEAQLRESDQARTRSHAELAQQVEFTRRGAEQLRDQAAALVTALRRPEARGRWGELQLRRVVELAGMTARCDFDEQVVTDGGGQASAPTWSCTWPAGRTSSLTPRSRWPPTWRPSRRRMRAVRDARLDAHARHLRAHVDSLASKAYWTALPGTPEFVILFIPGEAFLAPALERDPALLEYAIARRVHIATPTTLVSTLRTAHFAWQQQALSENARAWSSSLAGSCTTGCPGSAGTWTSSAARFRRQSARTTRRSGPWKAASWSPRGGYQSSGSSPPRCPPRPRSPRRPGRCRPRSLAASRGAELAEPALAGRNEPAAGFARPRSCGQEPRLACWAPVSGRERPVRAVRDAGDLRGVPGRPAGRRLGRLEELGYAVFFMASSLTVYYVRPGSLLPVVVSAPLLFLLACLTASVLAPSLALLSALAGAGWWMLASVA